MKDRCFLCEKLLANPQFVTILPNQTIAYLCEDCKEFTKIGEKE